MRRPTVGSTTDRRQWWREEAIRTQTDWRSLIELHCAIVDRLRASSSCGMICAICDREPCPSPTFCAACRDADRRKETGGRRHSSA